MAFFYGMALNLSLSAADLAEQNRMNEAEQMRGDVTELSQGPERDNKPVEVAMGSYRSFRPRPKDGIGQLFYDIKNKDVGTMTDANQPGLVPTEQEAALIKDNPDYSETATKKALAEELLSPEGQQRFADQGFQADAPPEQSLLNDAQEALDAVDPNAIPVADTLSTKTFIQESKNAANAEKQGFKFGDKNMASDELTDRILLQQQEAIKLSNDEAGFNFDRIDTEDSVKNIIQTMAKELEKEGNVVTQSIKGNRVQTNEETLREASVLIVDEVGFTRKILARKVNEGSLAPSELVAARLLMVRSAERLETLANKIKGKSTDENGFVVGATQTDRLALRRQMAIHAGIQLQIKGAQTEAARALQSFNINVGGGKIDPRRLEEEAARIVNDNGANVTTDALAEGILQALSKDRKNGRNGIGELNKFTRDGWYVKSKKMVHEAYLGGLLFQTASQFKNILGTATFMQYETLLVEPTAGVLGATYRKIKKGLGQERSLTEDQVYINDALIRMMAWGDSFKDAMRVASIAFKTEVPSTQVNRADLEDYTSITSGQDGQYTYLGKGINFVGQLTRLPFRGMLFGDEFFKTMSARGELYVRAHSRYQQSLRDGKTITEAQDDAAMLMLDPKSVGDELDYKARYDTMMSDLGEFGKQMGKVQRTLFGRFLFPFVVAPTNSVLRSAENVPYIPSKNHYEMIKSFSNDPRNKNNRKSQMAFAKASVGSGVALTVATLASERKITGGFPQDAKVREALPPNWQPYSLVFKSENWPTNSETGEDLPLYDRYGSPNGNLFYVSYAGFEPVGAMLGITADAVQRSILTRDPEARAGVMQRYALATKDYYLNLPALRGLFDIVRSFDAGNFTNLMRGPAENATILGLPNPMSGLQRMVNRLDDPIKKRVSAPVEYWTEKDILKPIKTGELYTKEDVLVIAAETGEAPNLNLVGQEKIEFLYMLPDGRPDYSMIGMEKKTTGALYRKFKNEIFGYASKDSMFRDENVRNATLYDTLGNVLGAEDVTLATAPIEAIFGNVTGFKVSLGREQTPLEKELVRVASLTNGWPLTEMQPRKNRIRFSEKVLERWTDESKNKAFLNPKGVPGGIYDFRGALSMLIRTRSYLKANDFEKSSLIKGIEDQYTDEGWRRLLTVEGNPEIDRLKAAFEASMKYRDRGLQR